MWLISALAFAQDAVTLDAVRKGQVGTAIPKFAITANTALTMMDAKFSCGGLSRSHHGPVAAGQRVEWSLDLPVGNYVCKGSLSIEAANGETGEMPLSFNLAMLPPLRVSLVPGSLSVADRSLAVTLDRTASRVEVTVLGPKGVELGGAMTVDTSKAGTPIAAHWSQEAGEVMKLKVRGYDENGFYGEMELSPWHYEVPHEDVVFATNSSDIDGAELPKLQAAMTQARQILDKYGSDVVIKLYIGGHTDTVGDGAHNQELSLARAKSIAGWFKKAGFPGDIYYQGFGEHDLAVPTADQVDEVKNRRASYVLSARDPEMPRDVPGLSWVMLH